MLLLRIVTNLIPLELSQIQCKFLKINLMFVPILIKSLLILPVIKPVITGKLGTFALRLVVVCKFRKLLRGYFSV